MNRDERIFAAPIVTLLVLTLSQISCGQSTQQSNERFFVKRPEGTSYKVIVSADGGGFRGLISSYILIELEDTIKRHILVNLPELLPESNRIESIEDFEVSLADYVDCFIGSSAGSWNSLYLASKGGNGIAANIFNEKRFIEKYGVIAPGSARGLLVLYNEFINGVFPQDLVTALNSNTNPGPSDPGVLIPAIPENEAESVFNGFYGRTTLSELSTSCMITGYDLITRSPILFVHDKFGKTPKTGFTRLIRRSSPRTRNMTFMSDIEGNYGLDYYISDVVTGSSAPPTLVSSHEVFTSEGEAERLLVADGGIYRSDPSFLAFTQIANSTGAESFADIAIMSITTGLSLSKLVDTTTGFVASSAGLQGLLNSLIYLVLNSVKITEQFYYSDPAVKPGQYLRIELVAQPETELNTLLNEGALLSTRLPELSIVGQQLAATYRQSIESFVESFIFG